MLMQEGVGYLEAEEINSLMDLHPEDINKISALHAVHVFAESLGAEADLSDAEVADLLRGAADWLDPDPEHPANALLVKPRGEAWHTASVEPSPVPQYVESSP